MNWVSILMVLSMGTITLSARSIPSGLVSDLATYFHSSCLLILSGLDGLADSQINIKLHRTLSEKGLRAGIVYITEAAVKTYLQNCGTSRPLLIVGSVNDIVVNYFIKDGTLQSLTSPRWLLFFGQRSREATMEIVRDWRAPFGSEILIGRLDTSGTILLSEVYRFDKQPLHSLLFGEWNVTEGLHIVDPRTPSLRRADLGGIVIRITAGHDPPYDHIIKSDKGFKIEGYSADVWQQLERIHNFTSVLYEVKNNIWGSIKENGKWNGMIGMIQDNKVDAAVNIFMMTPARVTVVDFLTPLFYSKSSTFIRTPGIMDSYWKFYLQPFHFSLWFALVSAAILTIIILLAQKTIRGNQELAQKTFNHFSDMLLNVCAVFVAQGYYVIENIWSIRFVYWSANILAVITGAAYSANLMASLAVRKDNLPFTSLEGLLSDGTYTFGVLADSGALTLFQNSTNNIMNQIYHKHLVPKHDHLPISYLDGLQKLCDEPKYALMEDDYIFFLFASSLSCETTVLPEASFHHHNGIIVTRTLPFGRLFRNTLEKMRITGILSRIYSNKWVQVFDAPEIPMPRIGVHHLALLFFLLGASIFCAIIILVCEKLKYRLHNL